MPGVSVIMPCHNHESFVRHSIEGVLRQSYRDLELIIVDDASKDRSWREIVYMATCDSRIVAIRKEANAGASSARNAALARARGKFIGFCDADDIWDPGKLARQKAMLDENPLADIAYSDSRIIDATGRATGQLFSDLFPPPKQPTGNLQHELLRRNFVNMQSTLMRRKCMDTVEAFDTRVKWVEDWLYWLQMSPMHQFVYCNEPLAQYRVHQSSSNATQKRGLMVNRFRVRHRALKTFSNLTPADREHLQFNMGVTLCELRKLRMGKRLLWSALHNALGRLSSLGIAKAIRRLCIHYRAAIGSQPTVNQA